MKIVIVDIDGTISKVGDRLKYLKQTPTDWDNFYEACFDDEPIEEMCGLVSVLSYRYDIIFSTGRRESVRDETVTWILNRLVEEQGFYCQAYSARQYISDILLMRPDGDHRHDTEIKPELITNAGIKLEDIAFVLEDRNSMVKKWRDMGLKCLQVADGDF